MPQPNFDKVEIVEPPIEELTKGRSWLRRVAFFGCGGFGLLVIVVVVIGWLALRPGAQTKRAVPEEFPANIPLYDKDSIVRITVYPGRWQARLQTLRDLTPGPLERILPRLPPTLLPPISTNPPPKSFGKKLWDFLSQPPERLESIQIEWSAMTADSDFVYNYYRAELRKKKFIIGESKNTADRARELTFSNDRGISGRLILKSEPNQAGTDYALLTVNLPL